MFLDDANKGPIWLINGGIETLKSYDINNVSEDDKKNNYHEIKSQLLNKISKEHITFLKIPCNSHMKLKNIYLFTLVLDLAFQFINKKSKIYYGFANLFYQTTLTLGK